MDTNPIVIPQIVIYGGLSILANGAIAYQSAVDFDDFYAHQQGEAISVEEMGEIVVISADGKGVIVRTEDLRPQTQKRAQTTNKKLVVRQANFASCFVCKTIES